MNESFSQPETDIMQLSPWEFDQTSLGWRKFQDRGEFLKAASVISEYIQTNKDRIVNAKDDEKTYMELLHFHRGQMLAAAGQEYWSEAIDSFGQAFGTDDECWNAYVSATIGFLEGNKEKIVDAIRIITDSQQGEKLSGNIGIVKNFKKALEEGVRDYGATYSWPRDEQ